MEEHNGHVCTRKNSPSTPSVIRLTEYIHIPFERRSLSRKNILLRDHSTCQYCGTQYPPSELTLDHGCRARVEGSPRGIIWLPAVNVAIIGRAPHAGRIGDALVAQASWVLAKRQPANHAYLGRADQTWRKYLSTNLIVENSGCQSGSPRGKEETMSQTVLAIANLGPTELLRSCSRSSCYSAPPAAATRESVGPSKRAFKEGLDEAEREPAPRKEVEK